MDQVSMRRDELIRRLRHEGDPIDEQVLIETGFKKYKCNGVTDRYSDMLYQKTIYTSDGCTKLYFLNAYVYLPKTYGNYSPNGQNQHTTEWSVMFNSRFYLDNDNSFDIDLHSDNMSIEDVFNFYTKAYESMDCIPDVHNND